MIDKIVGLCLLTVTLVCGTVLLREWLVLRSIEKRRAEQKQEERRLNRDKRFHDQNETLYLETKAKLNDAYTRIGILEDQLRRARETMSKFKIADIGKKVENNGKKS